MPNLLESENSPVILKLGGSIISHSNRIIDFTYLREFRDMLRDQILLGKRFVVTVGGGQTCRDYNEHAKTNGNITLDRDLHLIGAAVNTLNAEVVRAFLGDEIAEEHVWKYTDMDQVSKLSFKKPVVVAGGYKPGISSDGVALRIAQGLGAYKIFDLKNVDGVYSADPKTDPKAKLFPKLTWDEYLEIVGNPTEHKPGENLPVDAVAAHEAKELGATYYVIKATDFHNIELAINNQEFVGTIIS